MKGARTSTLTSRTSRPHKRGAQTAEHLFLALEADRPCAGSSRHALADVDAVLIGRGDARTAERVDEEIGRQLVLRVPDGHMSSTHARMVRVLGDWAIEDAGSKNGMVVNGARSERAILDDGDLVELGHTFFLFRDTLAANPNAPVDFDASRLAPAAPGLATLLPPLQAEFARLEAIARSPVTVSVRGESGTGKEAAARAVHQLSGRSGPFVAMNCGALPATLVESELFGYRKGAFSGAVEDRAGMVRAADGGTLFLDEIGDLPLPSQAAFLRVIEEHEVMPLGATRPISVDLRLVTATHRDLDALAAQGKFRADLLARISGFTLRLPPLRERLEDLGNIVAELLGRLAGDRAPRLRFTTEAVLALLSYPWPLNIREMEKCLGTAVVLAAGGLIGVEHLPEALHGTAAPRALAEGEAKLRDELVALLGEHHGNVAAVARAMGKARMQIHRWLKRFGIELEQFRDGA